MNMKRVFALLLTLAMALSLAACGAKKEEAPAAETPAEAPAERRQIRGGMARACAPKNAGRSGWAWSAPTPPTTGRRTPPRT